MIENCESIFSDNYFGNIINNMLSRKFVHVILQMAVYAVTAVNNDVSIVRNTNISKIPNKTSLQNTNPKIEG